MGVYRDRLRTISWRTVRVTLKNTRYLPAQIHQPVLAIFNAVFKHAAKQIPSVENLFFFHPLQQLSGGLSEGQEYKIEIVFPTAGEKEISCFTDALAGPIKNFELVEVSPQCQRNLETLEAETDPSLFSDGEICLEFDTPFSFQPKKRNRRWLIDNGDFFHALAKRVQHFYGLVDPLSDVAWQEVRLLPYYWHYEEGERPSASGSGIQYINGTIGPLYLRGNLASVAPLLLVCSELHAHGYKGRGRGGNVAHGVGHYRLIRNRPFFDPRLRDRHGFEKAISLLERTADGSEELEALVASPILLDECWREVADGVFNPGTAIGFAIPKRQGGQRLLGIFEARDRLVQKHLHLLLNDVLDRMLEETCIGYRCNRSREDAKRMISEAAAEGLYFVVESDIEAFFSQIDWNILRAKLRASLPSGDTLTLSLLERFIRMDMTFQGKPLERSKGLIEGSPLSPLLSNLYLDDFDEEMERRGYRLIRYADDFLVMVRNFQEGEKALADIREILATLKLNLKESKTAIKPLDAGISFLGLELGANIDEEFIEKTTLRKSVFIRQQYAFLGVDYDTLTIRKDNLLLDRLPLHRISEIIVLGGNCLSTRLIHKCVCEKIPISFCSAAGRYLSTIKPDSKIYFEVATRHANRFQELVAQDHLRISCRIVSSKIHNYLVWFRKRWPKESLDLRHRLEWTLSALAKAETIEQIRGYEGRAAAAVFHFINTKATEEFRSKGRQPRGGFDQYNSILNFSYHLLFTRINVLIRSAGLNPYLGSLHSHKDRYESLVCDVQELFRCRIDRFVLKIINLGQIQHDAFTVDTQGNHWMNTHAVGVLINAFEQEFLTSYAGDGGTLKDLLAGQVQALVSWVSGNLPEPFYYRAEGG